MLGRAREGYYYYQQGGGVLCLTLFAEAPELGAPRRRDVKEQRTGAPRRGRGGNQAQ